MSKAKKDTPVVIRLSAVLDNTKRDAYLEKIKESLVYKQNVDDSDKINLNSVEESLKKMKDLDTNLEDETFFENIKFGNEFDDTSKLEINDTATFQKRIE